MRCPFRALLIALLFGTVSPALMAQDPLVLPIQGRVFDAEKKLEGCEVITFKGNERINSQVTDRSGRFEMVLDLGEEFAIEFRKEGFIAKRILVDTRANLPKDVVEIIPIDMAMNMLPAAKYDGADTDALDFPFAIVQYNKAAKAFIQDNQYTADMMRTNGALLLMSGRAGKK